MASRLELHKTRDFGEVFGDATGFLKTHWKGIGRSLVVIVVPLYTIASIFFSIFSIRMVDAMTNRFTRDEPGTGFGVVTVIAVLLFVVAYLLAIGAVFAYIKVYSTKGEDEKIEPREVWKALAQKLAKIILFSLGYGIIGIIGFALISGILSALGPVIMIPFLVILYVIFFALVLSYLSVLMPVIFFENEGFFETLYRCFAIVKGNFWVTLGINFIAYLIVYFLTYGVAILFFLPVSLSMSSFNEFSNGFLKIIFVVAFIVIPLISFLAQAYYYTVVTMHYFNLLEKTNYIGLKQRIENIGQNRETQVEEEF